MGVTAVQALHCHRTPGNGVAKRRLIIRIIAAAAPAGVAGVALLRCRRRDHNGDIIMPQRRGTDGVGQMRSAPGAIIISITRQSACGLNSVGGRRRMSQLGNRGGIAVTASAGVKDLAVCHASGFCASGGVHMGVYLHRHSSRLVTPGQRGGVRTLCPVMGNLIVRQ